MNDIKQRVMVAAGWRSLQEPLTFDESQRSLRQLVSDIAVVHSADDDCVKMILVALELAVFLDSLADKP